MVAQPGPELHIPILSCIIWARNGRWPQDHPAAAIDFVLARLRRPYTMRAELAINAIKSATSGTKRNNDATMRA